MRIRIYNAISHDGYVLDKLGEHFIYFTADKKEFLTIYKDADCLVLDYENYLYLTKMKVLPATKKFVVVMTDELPEKGNDKLWFTALDPKQIKREIKIQGYSNVLCLVNNSLSSKILASKIATEVHIAIYHSIEGGGIEKVEIIDSVKKKNTPTVVTHKDVERLSFVLKKI
jgi:dihydrofolate reductase